MMSVFAFQATAYVLQVTSEFDASSVICISVEVLMLSAELAAVLYL